MGEGGWGWLVMGINPDPEGRWWRWILRILSEWKSEVLIY